MFPRFRHSWGDHGLKVHTINDYTLREECGSVVAESVMVAALLTFVALGVMQLTLALYVRNTVLDAAGEGARIAALAGNGLDAGVRRARELIRTSVGSEFTGDVNASEINLAGAAAIEVRVISSLPVIGLVGLPNGLEVAGHALKEISYGVETR